MTRRRGTPDLDYILATCRWTKESTSQHHCKPLAFRRVWSTTTQNLWFNYDIKYLKTACYCFTAGVTTPACLLLEAVNATSLLKHKSSSIFYEKKKKNTYLSHSAIQMIETTERMMSQQSTWINKWEKVVFLLSFYSSLWPLILSLGKNARAQLFCSSMLF